MSFQTCFLSHKGARAAIAPTCVIDPISVRKLNKEYLATPAPCAVLPMLAKDKTSCEVQHVYMYQQSKPATIHALVYPRTHPYSTATFFCGRENVHVHRCSLGYTIRDSTQVDLGRGARQHRPQCKNSINRFINIFCFAQGRAMAPLCDSPAPSYKGALHIV